MSSSSTTSTFMVLVIAGDANKTDTGSSIGSSISTNTPPTSDSVTSRMHVVIKNTTQLKVGRQEGQKNNNGLGLKGRGCKAKGMDDVANTIAVVGDAAAAPPIPLEKNLKVGRQEGQKNNNGLGLKGRGYKAKDMDDVANTIAVVGDAAVAPPVPLEKNVKDSNDL
ncbi:hypothetical protein RIF29_29565 [Crotalaria pallida]|uniref:Uncharacterized protein n=1 Tax=Crotalaria pallida TaxID=3830 RepID=A0AAN9EGY2_CROPI